MPHLEYLRADGNAAEDETPPAVGLGHSQTVGDGHRGGNHRIFREGVMHPAYQPARF